MTKVEEGVALGIHVPTSLPGAVVGYEELEQFVEHRPEPADSMWFGDHLLWHHPMLDPIVAAAFCAGVAPGAAIGFDVLLAPLREPHRLAKEIWSLGRITRSLMVGFGVGGEHRPEFDLLDVDMTQRGRIADETIAAVQHLLGPACPFGPPPGNVTWWVGGRSAAARARAARYGASWIGVWHTDKALAEHVRELEESSPGAAVGLHVFVTSEPSAGLRFLEDYYTTPASRFRPYLVPLDELGERLRAWRAAGVSRAVLHPAAPDVPGVLKIYSQVGDLSGQARASPSHR